MDDGVEAEELLWSLGVGEALPDWLRELRRRERAEGKNQHIRRHDSSTAAAAAASSRPGLGPNLPQMGAGYPVAITPHAPGGGAVGVRAAGQAAPQAQAAAGPAAKQAAGHAAKQVAAADAGPTQATLAQAAPRPAPRPPPSHGATEARRDVAAESERQPPAVGASLGAPEARVRRETFSMSIREWLCCLDDSGFVVQYHDVLAANFDSLRQIIDLYVKGGELDPRFFEDVGVKKLGHKRLFEKWVRDTCRADMAGAVGR